MRKFNAVSLEACAAAAGAAFACISDEETISSSGHRHAPPGLLVILALLFLAVL